MTAETRKKLADLGIAPRGLTREPHCGFVYFIECAGNIKIGWSKDWVRRVKDLQSANAAKIETLLVIKASREVEGNLHARFQEHKLQGEWYRPVHEICSFMDNPGHEVVYEYPGQKR